MAEHYRQCKMFAQNRCSQPSTQLICTVSLSHYFMKYRVYLSAHVYPVIFCQDSHKEFFPRGDHLSFP